MKKIVFFWIILFLCNTVVMAESDEKLRIAVFDPASSGTSIDDGTKIAVREIISSTIVNTGQYSIVERSLLEKIMEEQQFSNSGAVNDQQATEIGKLAGANKVVLSVVTLTGGRNMLSVKIVDVETATIERQKVKIVTSGELFDIIEPLTLEMLNLSDAHSETLAITETQTINPKPESESQLPSIQQPPYIPTGEIIMYGVDFSHVQIYRARETAQQFSKAFIGINAIFKAEAQKFDFSILTQKEVAIYTYPTDILIENIHWDYAMNSNGTPRKESVENIIKQYDLPHENGYGMVFIAWLLNKPEAKAYYDVVIFDIKTRNIIFDSTINAEAGGMSLRNFWATPIYKIIKNRKLRKQIKEVFSK